MCDNTNTTTQSIADYLSQLLKDRKQLAALPNVFIHLERLLDEGRRMLIPMSITAMSSGILSSFTGIAKVAEATSLNINKYDDRIRDRGRNQGMFQLFSPDDSSIEKFRRWWCYGGPYAGSFVSRTQH
ncbi:hypothetical protein M0804_001236 [Polistes exclamans]|nr:hypothetical protein M0804_001236 [Polistes exclamans]